ncbi:TIGR03915 family putative DNA repair protein [[Clostridium] polysaccharolyticum]|uniref:Probable DNA metabolism protein n=1 Tax=[Clostridium] polysaccharolyticum TaxID=29364 RepID=A0A1I0DXR7_9FIRM|nr:TIGR03915 family putative DNA repair protein [[Clostridium] polysaccharolyticum]SET37212.1 probable DNA metabolism protein [[Clostridium] polysaccharolyticum]
MKEKHIYICENSTTGIFTGIYDAWASKYGHENNRILVEEPENYEFFTKFIYVQPDLEKAEKVKRSIIQKISKEAYMTVYNGSISKDKEKADVIYRFLILGFAMGKGVLEHITNPMVSKLLKMDLNVKNEYFHYEGFLRFVKMGNNILFGRFRPENDIAFTVAEHFADRLQGENWIIYDEGRKKAAVHQAHGQWFAVEQYELDLDKDGNQLEEEDEFLSLWKCFVDSIAIKERTNKKLQLNMLPNRYREFMPETEYKINKK